MNKELSKKYFDGHPSVNEFFVTADEQHFFNEQQAINHANSLPDEQKEVVCVTREEACGTEDKAAAAKAKKIEAAKEKLAAKEQAVTDAKAAIEAEADEAKKQKLVTALTKVQGELTAAQTALAELEK